MNNDSDTDFTNIDIIFREKLMDNYQAIVGIANPSNPKEEVTLQNNQGAVNTVCSNIAEESV